jgi:hypothetical protein
MARFYSFLYDGGRIFFSHEHMVVVVVVVVVVVFFADGCCRSLERSWTEVVILIFT